MMISDNMRGAALMAGSMTAFTINDAFMKGLSGEIPLFQAIFMRGVGVVICLLLLCRAMGQLRLDLPRRDWALMWIRAASEAGGAYFFLTALFHMPIANVSAILQVLPLSVALAGALFMREPLGWRRLTAIVIGFLGVLLIVRPGGADFNVYSLYALACVACVTVRDLVVRRMSRAVPSIMVALVAAVGVTGLAALATLFGEWVTPSRTSAWELAGATLFVIGGYVFSVAAMRTGELSFVAPFRYTSLLVALILGAAIFGEFPAPLTLIGAAIVVATGLFTLYREQRLKLTRRAVPDRLR